MCSGMPSQVMRSQMDTDQIACFHHYCPCSLVGQRKDSFIRSDSFLLDIFFKPISDLLSDENGLELLATFGVPDDQFSAINIPWREIEHLANSHPTTGHEFQHETVPGFPCSENDFVNNLLFQNGPMNDLGRFEDFPEHRGTTRILKFWIAGVSDEIEESCR